MPKLQFFPKNQGIFPYIYLIYFMLPVSYTFNLNGLDKLLAFVLLAIFLIAYRQLYWQDTEHYFFSLLLGIQIAILFLLSAFFDINYIFLGFFPASFIGWYPNKKHFMTATVLFIIALTVPVYPYFRQFSIAEYIAFLPFYMAMILSPFATRSLYKKQELKRQLNEANAQIKELVKRDERVRIARDLHDTLGHTLSLITLKSQLVEKTIHHNPERALKEAIEIKNTSRLALKQVRELVSDMRSFTIAETLIEIRLILESARIQFTLHEKANISTIPRFTQNMISLCLKESVTNIIKHSQASVCTMYMIQEEGHLNITIQDNGHGIKKVDSHDGNGLKGISERLSLIDGALSIESINGTTITLSIPIIIRNGMEEGNADD